MRSIVLVVSCALLASGCGAPGEGASDAGPGNVQIDLRNLAATNEAATVSEAARAADDLIPTPSDATSRYFLLRTRTPLEGPIVSIIRQDRGEKTVYARTHTDCAARRFLIVGTSGSRQQVETEVDTAAALRPIEGLPLRQELAGFICARAGTPI